MSTAPISPLDEIRGKLRKYPQLAVVDDGNAITVKAQATEGFDVSFFCGGDAYTVRFADWHEQFKHAERDRALECFAFGLSDNARLRVQSRGGLDYHWTLEVLKEGEWRSDLMTSLLFFPFWRKKTVRYLQNDLIAADGFS